MLIQTELFLFRVNYNYIKKETKKPTETVQVQAASDKRSDSGALNTHTARVWKDLWGSHRSNQALRAVCAKELAWEIHQNVGTAWEQIDAAG